MGKEISESSRVLRKVFSKQFCFIRCRRQHLRPIEKRMYSRYTFVKNDIKKKPYGPFLWIGFNCLKATATSRRQLTFYHLVPRNSWYSFYRPRKDERLSQPWSHLVVLNTGSLHWESSALTARPLAIRQKSREPSFWEVMDS